MEKKLLCVAIYFTWATTARLIGAQVYPQDFLDAHNAARAEVGVGPMIWDDTVAAYAERYAAYRAVDCALVHSRSPYYGENIFWGGGDEFTAADAVNLWVGESRYYNYYTATCLSTQGCGHYTQVVWRDSVRLGCARVLCQGGGTFITCNYYPPGNYQGQRPY